jgi:hypothetical protein
LLTLKKTSKFITFILVFVGFFKADAGYKMTVNSFHLHCAEKDSLIVIQLAEFVEECQIKYDSFFDYMYREDVDIYLTRSSEEYEKFNRSDIPEWSSGVAYTKLRKIILKPGLYYDPGSYRETLFHEIAHMYIAEVSASGSVPVWLNEGLSMYLSEKQLSWQESIAIGNALSANSFLDLGAIDNLLRFSNAKAELAYLESFLAVSFLIRKTGEKTVAAMLRDFSLNYTLDEIFEKHVGYDFFEFEIEWYDDVKNSYRWMSWLQFENLLWFSFIIIIFVTFFLIKLRNRRIIKEWEREEYLDLEK